MAAQQLDSLIKFVNSQGTAGIGTLVQITRTNLVMEVYNPYSIVQLSEVLNNLILRRNDREIYNGRAVVSTLVNTGLYIVVSATLVDLWKDLSGLERNPLAIKEEASRFFVDFGKTKINPSFQLMVLNMRSLLIELSRWLEQVDLFAKDDGLIHDANVTNDLIQELKGPIMPQLMDMLLRFEEEASMIPFDEVEKHKALVHRDLHPLLLRSPFMWRTYTKPLGYAGDYEMVNMILRDPDEGPTTYAKLLNNAFLTDGPAEGHRNRVLILTETLKFLLAEAQTQGQKKRVLNVACGPAMEVQRLVAEDEVRGYIDFDLLDFNDETLDFLDASLKKVIKEKDNDVDINYIHKSVHALLKEAGDGEQNAENQYDMVYCAGLFDYLSDRVCNRLMRYFWNNTKQGGTILVTNVHPSNPVKYGMEYLMEWHLIYRDEAGMEKLLPNCGEQKIYKDVSGFNIFLEITKTP
ncbi:MAG: extracellular factor (EF) 3-hydroxypalmitic acid methyl ester biosynthesis protein [Saprospiraceae bacterium]|jgi:extracellular factor (EF) 3-hydroxypalmitic acid methyl ester biosynthesis protein